MSTLDLLKTILMVLKNMSCCKAEIFRWCEREDVVYTDTGGKEYCVFHAPQGKKGITVKEFKERVFKRINDAKSNASLYKASPAGPIPKNKKEIWSCNLSGTIFEGDIDFGNLTSLPPINFFYSTFSGTTGFENVVFNGEANFKKVTFNNIASFALATFKDKVCLDQAKFNKVAAFNGTIFEDKAYFRNVRFSSGANFSIANFKREAIFSGSGFGEEADFNRTTFNEDAYFLGETFITRNESADNTPLEKLSSDDWVNRRNAEEVYPQRLTKGNFKELNIKGKIRFERSNFTRISFLDTDLRKIDFINCVWPKKFGREILYDEIILFGDEDYERFKGKPSEILKREWSLFKRDISCDKEEIKKVEILYRRLKQKFKEEHDEAEVSNWHYGEKEMRRKGNRFRRLFPLSLSNLYWFSSGYGERPLRAGVVLLLLIFTISALFRLAGLIPSNASPSYEIIEIKSWTDLINFHNIKAIVLNTLQYATFENKPDFIPRTIYGGYLKLVTRILIPLQAALFVLAVRNRFRR